MELLIVIVVLGLLAGIVIFSLTGVSSSAAVAACHTDATSVENAVNDYNAQNPGGTATAGLLTNTPPVPGAVTYLHSMPSSPDYSITIINGSVMIAAPSNATPVAYGTGDPCSNAGSGGGGMQEDQQAVSSNGVVAAPSNSNSPYFGQDTLTINNTSAITSMSVTINVALTTGLSYNGEYVTYPGGAGTLGHSSGGGTLTYTYVLNSGQTITSGYNGVVAAQFNGTGTARVTTGDTWTVTSTTSSGTRTISGTF